MMITNLNKNGIGQDEQEKVIENIMIQIHLEISYCNCKPSDWF